MSSSSTTAPQLPSLRHNPPAAAAAATPTPASAPAASDPATRTPHSFPPPPADDNDGDTEPDLETHAGVPPAAAVRLSVMRRMWAATNDLQRVRRWRLAFFGVLGLAQIIAFVALLAGHYNDLCDVPLAPYLVMVVVRIAVAYPPYFWLTISPPRPDRRDPEAVRAALDRDRHIGSLAIDHRVRRLSDLVSIYSVVLFVLGNWWVITATSCPADSPTLYKGALAALVLSWLYVAELLVWAILIIFFLPFFLIGARWFGVGQKKNEIGPLKKDDIASLPQRIFVGILPEETPRPAQPSSSLSTETTPSSVLPAATGPSSSTSAVPPHPPPSPPAHPVHRSRRQIWRLWRRRRAKGPAAAHAAAASEEAGGVQNATALDTMVSLPPGVEPLRLPESQAACAICLCEYEPPPLRDTPQAANWQPERLALLPCGHAFHVECLGDWLAVSGRCPLCQRDLHRPKRRRRTTSDRSTQNAGDPGPDETT